MPRQKIGDPGPIGQEGHLLCAIQTGTVEEVEDAIDGIDLGTTSRIYGKLPLHEATIYGQIEVLEFLLTKGANPYATDRNGNNVLHIAVMHEQTEIALFLLRYGVDPNSKNIDGNSALHIAALFANTCIMYSLLHHGVHRDARNNRGHTASYLYEWHWKTVNDKCLAMLSGKENLHQ